MLASNALLVLMRALLALLLQSNLTDLNDRGFLSLGYFFAVYYVDVSGDNDFYTTTVKIVNILKLFYCVYGDTVYVCRYAVRCFYKGNYCR